MFNEFERYIKEHYNNIFADVEHIEYDVSAIVIAKQISGEAKEVLGQIVESPKFDGDVVSKSGKSELFHHNLILRIANNNEFGDNAANSLGFKVWQLCREGLD